MKKLLQILNMRYWITLGLMFISVGMLSAQDGWEKTYEFYSLNDIQNVVISHDGHIVARLGSLGQGASFPSVSKLLKMKNNGEIIWSKDVSSSYYFSGNELKATSDGGFILNNDEIFTPTVELIKTDSLGNIEWSVIHTLSPTFTNVTIQDILEYSDGGFLFTGQYRTDNSIQSAKQYLAKTDANGNLLWYQAYGIEGDGTILIENAQNEILIGGHSNFVATITKTSPSGNILWTKEYEPVNTNIDGTHLSEHSNGNFHLVLPSVHLVLDNEGTVLMTYPSILGLAKVCFLEEGFVAVKATFGGLRVSRHDYEGNVLWEKFHNYQLEFYDPNDIIQTSDSGFVVGGNLPPFPTYPSPRAFLLKMDSLGFVYHNELSGTIKIDENDNCLLDSLEVPLENWVVTATKQSQVVTTFSDENGEYFMGIDTGIYELTVTPPYDLWTFCDNNILVDFTSTDNKDTIDFAVQLSVDCPLLEVNSTIPILRPCFDDNTYSVSWCNYGTITAEDAYLEIILDPAISPVSTTLPWTTQNGDTLIFNLGDIPIGECGNFQMELMLDCGATLGASYCIETHIYPDSLCIPPSPIWNGAYVEVSGVCQDSVVNFKIENTGMGDMSQDGTYIIVEDAVMLLWNNFNLLSGESDPFTVPANGSTYTLLATQEPGAPGNMYPISSIEGCEVNGTSNFSIGFLNQFFLGDIDPFVDIDCPIASASYDPNDKLAFPIGYGDEHYIEPNTDIEYMIRFQNTGTDTAFNVVLLDTLDESLDITTLRQGAGTHDYQLEIIGGNILQFTFSNIMLPDSNINEIASHGAVEFKISQKPDLPLGTVIKNKAAIYFDFNPPIITNETFHTLGLDFITVSLQNPTTAENSILVRPNPMQDFAIFELKKEIRNGLFELYDVTGKLAWQQKFNSNQFELKRNENLKTGIYFYKIYENNKPINVGKIIVN